MIMISKFFQKAIDKIKWFLFEKKRQPRYEPLDPIIQ